MTRPFCSFTVKLMRIEGGDHGPSFPRAKNPPDYKSEMVKWFDQHLRTNPSNRQRTRHRHGIISNHTDYDSTISKLHAFAARKPGERHPFLTGADSVRRYMTVVEEVGRATLAATAEGKQPLKTPMVVLTSNGSHAASDQSRLGNRSLR